MTQNPVRHDSIPPQAGLRDWFRPAFDVQGTVADSFRIVTTDLERRAAFVRALHHVLCDESEPQLDAITVIGNRVKALENTLRFRLGMLAPEREGAWFRPPVMSNFGPYTPKILAEPVFAPYERRDVARVRAALRRCWDEGRVGELPFKTQEPCLWRSLLATRERLATLNRLPEPFAGLTIDRLPENLPDDLTSPALQLFLLNVRAALSDARLRATSCHEALRGASEKLWAWQERQAPTSSQTHSNEAADRLREEFRKRRETRKPSAAADISATEALRFMGFSHRPTDDELRRRFHALAREMHPDCRGGDEESFKKLTRAYEKLSP